MKVLLNCDLGEGEPAEVTEALVEHIDLANIACGGHAGDEATLRRVLRAALPRGVQTGAHPGWPDRENFGRQRREATARDLTQLLAEQIGWWQRLATEEGATLGHVKLHGALYHLCDEREDLAEACVDWMQSEAEGCTLVVGAGGLLHAVAEARGVPLLREIFAERIYATEAKLAERGTPGAVLESVAEVAERMTHWRQTGCLNLSDGRSWLVEAETICVHADTPGSPAIVRAVREIFAASGPQS